MSAYATFTELQFKSRELLLQALADLGWDASKIEEGQGLTLYGWHGDARPERAEIVIRRRYVSSGANDVGFKLTPAGYVPIISENELRSRLPIAALRTAYSKRVVAEVGRRLHGHVTSTRQGSVIKYAVRFS